MLKPLSLVAAFLLTPLVSTQAYSADNVYRYVDSKGRVTFSDRAKHDGYVQLVKTWKGWKEPQVFGNWQERRQSYYVLIEQAAEKYNLDPALIKAVIHAESHFNPTAVSSAGAVGLMQLMPATAAQYGVYNRQNAKQNIDAGSRHLSRLIEMFDHDLELAVAAYNAGENAVKRRGNTIPPFKETQNYVVKVQRLYNQYLAADNAKELFAARGM